MQRRRGEASGGRAGRIGQARRPDDAPERGAFEFGAAPAPLPWPISHDAGDVRGGAGQRMAATGRVRGARRQAYPEPSGSDWREEGAAGIQSSLIERSHYASGDLDGYDGRAVGRRRVEGASACEPTTLAEVSERAAVLPGGSSVLDKRAAVAERERRRGERERERRQSQIDSTIFGQKVDERSGRQRQLSVTEHPYDPTSESFDPQARDEKLGSRGLSSLPVRVTDEPASPGDEPQPMPPESGGGGMFHAGGGMFHADLIPTKGPIELRRPTGRKPGYDRSLGHKIAAGSTAVNALHQASPRSGGEIGELGPSTLLDEVKRYDRVRATPLARTLRPPPPWAAAAAADVDTSSGGGEALRPALGMTSEHAARAMLGKTRLEEPRGGQAKGAARRSAALRRSRARRTTARPTTSSSRARRTNARRGPVVRLWSGPTAVGARVGRRPRTQS